ncbi:hypothetical protein C8R45DRAFT_1216031 [Mycena sanguinolenta]|nr:hypothetical protein C8R45DRAFT_1216031 [Mycena sanguinolenta]
MPYHANSPLSDNDLSDHDAALDAAHGGDNGHNALTSQTLNADGTPKRPMNAFMIFARRRRPQVSAENQSMRTGDISKILSQEWKAMGPTDKQFYLAQAKQLKETFNSKYPDYVYRRRPNNTRKRRPAPSPHAQSHSSSHSPHHSADGESSPDAETPPPLPSSAPPYDARYHPSSLYPSSQGGYAYGAYGAGGSHVRNNSYPYPAGAHPYDSPRAAYYPLYDANAPSSSTSPNLGLRKATSIPSGMGSSSHPSGANSNGYYGQQATYSPPTRYTPYPSSSPHPPSHPHSHPHSHSTSHPHSHSHSSSTSTSTSSPVPAYSPAPAYSSSSSGSPPATYSPHRDTFPSSATANGGGSPHMGSYGAPRALSGLSGGGLNGMGGGALGLSGGGLGLSGLGVGVGVGGGGEEYGGYWRGDKLL